MSEYPDNRSNEILELVLRSHDYELVFSKDKRPTLKCKHTRKAVSVYSHNPDKIYLMYHHLIEGHVTHSCHAKTTNAAKAIIKFLGK